MNHQQKIYQHGTPCNWGENGHVGGGEHSFEPNVEEVSEEDMKLEESLLLVCMMELQIPSS